MSRPLIKNNKTFARLGLYGFAAVVVLSAVLFWARISSSDHRSELLEGWPSEEMLADESVALLQEYLRIDSSAPDGSEVPAAEFLARHLRAAGIATHIERLGARNANLWARLEGADPRALVLNNHLDVEPIHQPEQWQQLPFSGDIVGPFIFGRGVFDMKSVAIAQLMSMLELARSDRPLARSVVFLAVGDEESGSHLGLRRVLQEHPEWPETFWAALTEGGAVEAVTLDEIKYWGTEFHQKRFVDIWLCSSDRRRLRRLQRDARDRQLPRRLLTATADFFRQYGPTRGLNSARDLMSSPATIIERLSAYPRRVDATVISPFAEALMHSELHVLSIERQAANMYRLRLVIGMLPDEALNDVWPALIGDLLDGFTYTVEDDSLPLPASPLDHPVFLAIDEAVEATYPGVVHGPMFLPYTRTDARVFRAHGTPAYGFSPFKLIPSDGSATGQPNERMPIAAFVDGVELYKAVVRDLVWTDATDK